MARPTNADAAATRGRILSEASRLFAAQGPSAVSIRDIAREAKVSLAMVHHYFGSKDELYVASVDAMYDELAGIKDELTAVLGHARDTREALALAAARGFGFARDHAEAVRTVLRAAVETGQLPAGRPRAMLAPFLEAVEAFFGPELPHLDGAELRLRAQTVCFVIARYAVASIEDLALITGAPAGVGAARVLAHVEAHLGGLATSLLAAPSTAPSEGVASSPSSPASSPPSPEDPSCPAPSPSAPSPAPASPSRSRRAPSKARPRRATTASRR